MALAAFSGVLISAVFAWPVVVNPRSTVALDLGDPLLQAWQLAWQRRRLVVGGDFWTANFFHPAPDSVAFSDALLGYFPFALLGGEALLRYNVAYVCAPAVAYLGAYLLARQLGGTWQAAALAGAVFAWAPWRLPHGGHLNILSTGGIALALFALARGHGWSFRPGVRGEARPWWALVGWVLATWQMSLGFAIGIPFFYFLLALGVVLLVFVVRHRFLFLADVVGMVFFALSTYFLTVPYLRVVDRYGFTRPWEEVATFSPPVSGLWTVADLHRLAESGMAEKALSPGLTVVLPALLGLAFSAWPPRVRATLAAGVVLTAALALGVTVADGLVYRVLWDHLPGWSALRTPGRLILWTTLLLTLLAAGAVSRLRTSRLPLLLTAAVLVEGFPDRPYHSAPTPPPDVRQALANATGPVLLLPMRLSDEYTYLLWSTEDFPTMANGNSGLFPPTYEAIRKAAQTFPDSPSVAVLDEHDIKQVVLIKPLAAGTPYAEAANRPLAGLPVTKRESDDVVVFTLR